MSRKSSLLLAFLLVPGFAHAQGGILGVMDLLIQTFTAIVPILLSLAVLVFLWGVVKFVAHAGDEKAVEEGKTLMVWGMVGLFVMVGVWGIVGYIQSSLGLTSAGLPAYQQQGNVIPVPPPG